MVLSLERLPIMYDTETGKYVPIKEENPSTCEQFPIEYDPKTERIRDNPKYTGGCKKFQVTVSDDYKLYEHEEYKKTETVKIGF